MKAIAYTMLMIFLVWVAVNALQISEQTEDRYTDVVRVLRGG